MFSGKTEELIRRVKRTQIARQKIQIFQHRLDARYGASRIASHSGFSVEARTVPVAEDILALVEPDTQVVAIDEVQFFGPAIATVCDDLAAQGRRVIAAGLDMDFRGEPFGAMPLLLAQAELVDKLQAICVQCAAPASRTQRLVDGRPACYDDPIIMVGASEVYEARCRQCHDVPRRERS
jgi:thymidine kinase